MRYRLARRPMRGSPRHRHPLSVPAARAGSAKLAAAGNMKATATVTIAQTAKLGATANMTATSTKTRLEIVPFTADELLDMAAPRRLESFRFDVQDAAGNVLGQLAVTNESEPTLSNDVSRRIRRDLTNVVIPPRPLQETGITTRYFSEDINTQQHRIKVWHVLGTGGPGYELPLGVFLFSNDPRKIATYGNTITATLDDLSQLFDQKVVESVTFSAGTNIATALASLYADAGIDSQIDATSVTLGNPVTMLAFKDSRQSTADALCAIAGFLPPYFSNDGVGICRAAPDLTSTTPTLVYGAGSRAFADDIIESSGQLLAPNLWIAEGGATDNPIVGRYALPADDPHSFESIGYYITDTISAEGIDTQSAADEAARAGGVTSRKQLRRRHWTSPIDSRHDTFDPIGWDAQIDLEQSWSMTLAANGTMTHESIVLAG